MEYFKEFLQTVQVFKTSLVNKSLRNEKKGEISVFLTLIFSVISSLIIILLQSAQINASKVRMERLTDLTVNSVFSEYNKYLYERYGLLYIDTTYKGKVTGGDDCFINHLSQYVDANLSDNIGTLSINYVSSGISNCKYVTEDDKSLYQQIEYFINHFQPDTLGNCLDKYIEIMFSSRVHSMNETYHNYEIEYIICGFEGDDACYDSILQRIIRDRTDKMCDEQNCHPFDDIFVNYEDRELEMERYSYIREQAEIVDNDIYLFYIKKYLEEIDDELKISRIKTVITNNIREFSNPEFDFSKQLYSADITIYLENSFGKIYEGFRHYSLLSELDDNS